MKKSILIFLYIILLTGFMFFLSLKRGKIWLETAHEYKSVLINDSLNVSIVSIVNFNQYSVRYGGDDIYISTPKEKLYIYALSISNGQCIYNFASTGDIIQKKMNNDTIVVIKKNSDMRMMYKLKETRRESKFDEFIRNNL